MVFRFQCQLVLHLQVEAALLISSYVEITVLHADPFRNHCVALVVVSQPALEDWALTKGIKYVKFSDLCFEEDAIKEVLGSLRKVYYIMCTLRLVLKPLMDFGRNPSCLIIYYSTNTVN